MAPPRATAPMAETAAAPRLPRRTPTGCTSSLKEASEKLGAKLSSITRVNNPQIKICGTNPDLMRKSPQMELTVKLKVPIQTALFATSSKTSQ